MAGGMISRGQKTEDGRQQIRAAAPRLFARFLVFCLLSFVLCPMMAEELPDPTRPPASIFAPVVPGNPRASEERQSGLHTIIISGTRRAAIIDGQLVELGDEHRGARLVEVNENGVVLQRAQGRQVLPLFPDVKISSKKLSNKNPDEKDPAQKKLLDKGSANKQPLSASAARQFMSAQRVMPEHPKEEK